MSNLQELQNKIETYKSQRKQKKELEKKVQELEEDLANEQKKQESVEELLQAQKRIDLELAKFGELGKDPRIDHKVEQIQQKRQNIIIEFLKTIGKILRRATDSLVHQNTRGGFVGSFIIGLLFLQLFIATIFYIASESIAAILIGLGSVLINLVLLIFLNKGSDLSVDFNPRSQNHPRKFSDISKQNDPREDEFLVNSAWVEALKAERAKIASSIKLRLGKEEDGANNKESNMNDQDQLTELKQNLQNLANSMISSEEYLKLRREMDILKIEGDN